MRNGLKIWAIGSGEFSKAKEKFSTMKTDESRNHVTWNYEHSDDSIEGLILMTPNSYHEVVIQVQSHYENRVDIPINYIKV